MRMKVLCVGDVVGSVGRRALTSKLAEITEQHQVSCSIVNAENIASGSGITPNLYQRLIKSGVNLITLGDHIYRRREIVAVLESSEQIVRPANFPSEAPGREFAIHQTDEGHRVAVFSLMGRLFMKPVLDCPFRAADRVLGKMPDDVRVIICDVHAEATSEKVAMGWHLDGRVSVVVGTHTHVPTADERILPGGAGYVTDLGMTGPYDSVLGRDKQRVLQSMITGVPTRFEVAEGQACVCGIVAEIDVQTGRCTHIERIRYECESPAA